MPTVPNWIAKAVVFTPHFRGLPTIEPILPGWRATRTEVVVQVAAPHGPVYRRFRLSDLKRVNDPGPLRSRLAGPDDPEVLAAISTSRAFTARHAVLDAMYKERLHESTADAEATMRSLVTIRAAIDKAMADLGQVL